MDNRIEEGKLLLLKNKEKVFKNYFIEFVIILLVLSVADWVVDIVFLKSFSWWEIPLDIVLSVVIALVSAWLQHPFQGEIRKEISMKNGFGVTTSSTSLIGKPISYHIIRVKFTTMWTTTL